MVGEERVGPSPELRSGVFAFVVEVLGISQPRVVINGVVQVPITHAGPVASPRLASQLAVPTAVGDAPELFDVEVDEISGFGVLVAARPWPADWQAAGLVQIAQERHLVSAQYGLDGRAGHPQVSGDAVRAPAAGEAHLDEPSLPALRQPPGAVMGPAGPINHRVPAANTR